MSVKVMHHCIKVSSTGFETGKGLERILKFQISISNTTNKTVFFQQESVWDENVLYTLLNTVLKDQGASERAERQPSELE